MGFFLRKTWIWWLLAALLAWLITWLLCRWRNRRGEAAELVALRDDAARANALAAERQTRIDGLLAQRARDLDDLASARAGAAGSTALGFAATTVADKPVPTAEQLAAGAALLGRRLQLDDLKVVEGIGPAIEELLHNDGIRTWRGLEAADPSALKGILDAAGARFRVHDPATWPRQAGLLADARWQDFKDLTDELTAGRE
jgi:predicted flap endonuclease-1-like 5' DNA nuclease